MNAKIVRSDNLDGIEEASGKVVLCKNHSPAEVIELATEVGAKQVVHETNEHCAVETKSSVIMLDTPRQFLDFPMCAILTPDDINKDREQELRKLEISFSKSSETEAILDQIVEYVEGIPRSGTLAHDIRVVADEVISNALYNAPFGKERKRVSRSEAVELEKSCRVSIAHSDSLLVLLCEDPFGSLRVPEVLAQIEKCYKQGAAGAMVWEVGGAGIGSFMVFQSCGSLYYGVLVDQKTIVACLFPIGISGRKRAELGKGLHVVYEGFEETKQ